MKRFCFPESGIGIAPVPLSFFSERPIDQLNRLQMIGVLDSDYFSATPRERKSFQSQVHHYQGHLFFYSMLTPHACKGGRELELRERVQTLDEDFSYREISFLSPISDLGLSVQKIGRQQKAPISSNHLVILDPFFHQIKQRAYPILYWIHGWSEERWVRRYSVSQMKEIQRLSKRFPVMVGHSGRFEQWIDFLG